MQTNRFQNNSAAAETLAMPPNSSLPSPSRTKHAKVYFSYSWQDTSARMAISAAIKTKHNITIHCDRDDNQLLSVTEIIGRIVANADALIVLVSVKTMQSRYVIEEIIRSSERCIPFIPVFLETVPKENLPECISDIPRIQFDATHPESCVDEIKARIESVEADMWMRRSMQLVQQSVCAIRQLNGKHYFLKAVASEVLHGFMDELSLLANERYRRDISIEHNYLTRGIPLFESAEEVYAVSVAGVSTFWTDKQTRPAAVRYSACNSGKFTIRLFVFNSARELNDYKHILTVNNRRYGDNGGVYVCSQAAYEKLFESHSIKFLRIEKNQDFGLLRMASAESANGTWVKAELDKDYLHFETVEHQHLQRLEAVVALFRSFCVLKQGDISDKHVLRWEDDLSINHERLAQAMRELFPSTQHSVCHMVLFQGVDSQTAENAIWPLRQQTFQFRNDDADSSNCWIGTQLAPHAVRATHGNSNLKLVRELRYTHAMKVTFPSFSELETYYRNIHHADVRRNLYTHLIPSLKLQFDSLAAAEAEKSEGWQETCESIWDQIEHEIASKIVRFDFVDQEPESVAARAPGIEFGTDP